MSEQDGKRPVKSDTLDAIASARTLPSDAGLNPLASAATQVAPPAPSFSGPRLPHEGGEVLGNRYELLGELGRGGEGVVYRARDLKADAIVALKLLQHDEGAPVRLQRFRRELAMARKVTHPNVVRIHDLVELPGRFGLTMELVDGEPLDARIHRGKLTRDELVRLALDLARALGAAHEAGVTHRDLKPANVLLRARDGQAMVTDFGVSRAHGVAAEEAVSHAPDATPLKLTREGAIIGTPQYMAPEQLEGRTDIGPAADVYAFGVVLYEAATGERLHEAQTLGDLRHLRLESAVRALRERRPDLPRVLCDVVDRSLSREPADRYSSGVELLAALEPLAPRGKGAHRRRSALSAPMWLALAAVALAAGAVVLVTGRPAVAPPAVAPSPTASAPSTRPFALPVSNVRRLTFGDACQEFPSFASDGKTLVYDGTVGPDAFIYALDVSDGATGATPRQVTHVHGWDIAASVSPKGDRIAFLRFEGEHVGAYVASLDGSEPHLVAKGAVRPSWTRDGNAVWAGTGAPLEAHDADTGAIVRVLPDTPPVRSAQTAELADGSLVGVLPTLQAAIANRAVVAIFPPGGGMRTLFDGYLEEVLAVTPDQGHVLVSRMLPTGLELLDLPIDGSPAASLAATGISARKGMSFSPDGRHLTWSACGEAPQLVGTDARGRLSRPVQGDLGSTSSLAAIPGTSEVAVVSARAGKPELWIASLTSSAPPRAIALGTLSAREIAVAPDGLRFVITVPGDGLYVGSLTAPKRPERITSDGLDSSPAFVAGGARVVFARHPPHEPAQVMSVPADGSAAPTPLLESGSDRPTPSPVDDRLVYLAGATNAEAMPTVFVSGTGARHVLSASLHVGNYSDVSFSPDGRRILLVRGDTELVEVDVSSGAIVRTLSTPSHDQLQHPAYTSAGLVVMRVPFQGNVWLADVAP